jgi:hypothetical protein
MHVVPPKQATAGSTEPVSQIATSLTADFSAPAAALRALLAARGTTHPSAYGTPAPASKQESDTLVATRLLLLNFGSPPRVPPGARSRKWAAGQIEGRPRCTSFFR